MKCYMFLYRYCKLEVMHGLEKLAVIFYEMYFNVRLLTCFEKFLKYFSQTS